MLTQAMIRTSNSAVNPNLWPADVAALARAQIEMIGAVMPFARNAEIYGENERAEYLYKVLKGSVRTYKVLQDGRRQIGAFYLPGDVFGFEVGDDILCRPRRLSIASCSCSAERRLRRWPLVTAQLPRQLWAMTVAELQRAQDHVMLLVKTAQERVAGFSAGNVEAIARRRRD